MALTRKRRICCLIVLAGASCRSTAPMPSSPGSRRVVLNEGYSLLYEVLTQQKDVDMILIVKSEEDDVDALITKIATTCGEAAEQLEALAEADTSVKLDLECLPVIEENTRAAIEATALKEHFLSFGWKFELILLLAQDDALSYVSHLAAVLGKEEEHPERKAFLERTSTETALLRDAVIDLMSSRYQPGYASRGSKG